MKVNFFRINIKESEMAKVFLELESSAITDLTEEKIQKLESIWCYRNHF